MWRLYWSSTTFSTSKKEIQSINKVAIQSHIYIFCFQMEGVERVVLGYAGGGKQEKPTTAKLYGHAEALLIEFKPHTVSYRQILEVWHECDNPWEVEKSQYRSTLFWKSLSQQNIALQFVQELQAKNPSKPLHTVVERIHKFYMAKQICPLVNLVPQVEQNHIALVACGSLLGPKKRFLEVRRNFNLYGMYENNQLLAEFVTN
jgi:peptide-methionine (S)-S-oxide reductase